jgi:hypothetical protein
MGIADLFRPKYRHSDVRVRTEAVKALTADDAATLIQVAQTDRDIGVRRIAIEKINEATALAEIAAAETERSLREFAGERAAQLYVSTACKDNESSANDALSGIIKLGDQHALIDVAVSAKIAAVRKRAFGELRDPKALAELAKNNDAPQDLRLAAVGRIDDGDVLRALAVDTTSKEVGLAAVDKLDDNDRLDNIANKAKNKAVRQRARKVVQELNEAERAKKKPVVPDDVKRRRAEKAQLVRELESLAETFDFAKAAVTVKAAQESWAKLESGDEGDERFTKAVERFWKRKDIHEQQTRSADELRAIEREAQRERDRAAAERAAAAAAPPPPAAEPVVDADAQARREEREKRKAEEDARRAADQAARDARRKEDAERGVAIAASLAAMVEDMEKLDTKDGRAIDRLLQQAGKAFEQIGKVPPDQRDALGDRYTKARGKLVVRVSELREARDWQAFANVPKAEALIATAKDMLAEEPTPDLGNRLRQLQALWKEVGPMPQRRSKELWEQFKALCDQIYDKVKGFRSVENEKFADVAKQKEALITEAEALADSTDWQTTANKLKELQAKWKQSGHLPRKQGDELWKRFRAACDKFFERRKPELDARHAEEEKNLAAKQALIARAQAVAASAPGEGGWGKAITEIKNLQQQWKEIGYVPRKDADAVYKGFRAACDSLFAKRDEARDAEANEHRTAIDNLKGEIADVLVGGDDVVQRALEIRKKARELDSKELARSVEQMLRHVVTANAEAVKGTELDPAAARNRREKLITKAEELLPKSAPQASNDADIATQLKNAMRSNAFGDLRFSGRDPVEVVDELRTQWLEAGPVLDDEDRVQETRFDDVLRRALEAANATEKPDRSERGERGERGDRGERGRRQRRDRRSQELPINTTSAADDAAATTAAVVTAAAFGAPAAAATLTEPPIPTPGPAPAAVPTAAAIPQTTNDAVTAPAKYPFEPLPAPPVPAEPARAKTASMAPPIEELDSGWDLGDDDPTATSDAEQAAASADSSMQRPEPEAPPSASEMAGDSATGGDGIDEPGWD